MAVEVQLPLEWLCDFRGIAKLADQLGYHVSHFM